MNEFVVYVLYSEKYDKYYTGFTSSLIERFYSHNNFLIKDLQKKSDLGLWFMLNFSKVK
ncbi:GIY-YIG catalytic domain-containing protein [Halpernia humi]|uniref:GIY-YIG catalytic domain-containing protein n=1 Tax=Halpernia humi TaxID=493375 RepID=A0A1H5TUZ8_9FLAO|nr:GIY-YIG catalytic domain-containing protein [Halpernia humi]